MNPHLVPIYLDEQPTAAFQRQLGYLRDIIGSKAEWAEPVHIDAAVPADADAVIVPDLNVLAYRMVNSFRRIDLPILVITSEFGTVSMWDWEIRDFLRRRDVKTVAPTSVSEAIDVVRSVAVRAELGRSSMLVYLDDLGAGMQPDIFKRFYWYEEACAEDAQQKLGVSIERRSFRELSARASAIGADRVEEAWRRWSGRLPIIALSDRARDDAMRLYVALGDEIDESSGVIAAGINCLNESASSPTTPCLAWNLLFEERGLLWGCESDIPSMLTKFIVHKALDVPVMMTNLYPFLLGDTALKHEKIPHFPETPNPNNHILAAHCGYFGVVPQSFASEWSLKPPVLEIVDENAHAIDARFPTGQATIVKLTSTFEQLFVAESQLTEYVQYENSDCLNGAVLRVRDGFEFVERLPSHHVIIAVGDLTRRLLLATSVLDLEMEKV